MSIANAILNDLLADDSDWWAGELQTVTGHFRAEYLELLKRLKGADFELSASDRHLLRQAGFALIAYEIPMVPTVELQSLFGEEWRIYVEDFIELIDGQK